MVQDTKSLKNPSFLYWYGDPVSDLAVQTDSSANRISVRLFRLREKLRNTLKKEGFSP